MEELEILDPTITGGEKPPKMAARLDSLNGKVVGALWNGRPQEDAVLKGILTQLEASYRLKGTRFYRKPQLYTSAPADMFDEIVAECDAMITGVGT